MIWSTKCWKVREYSAIICWRENEKSRSGLPIFVTLIGRGRLSRELGGGVPVFVTRETRNDACVKLTKCFGASCGCVTGVLTFYFIFTLGVLWFLSRWLGGAPGFVTARPVILSPPTHHSPRL